MVFVIVGFLVKELMGDSFFFFRYLKIERYALGYLFLISILLILKNPQCMLVYVLAILSADSSDPNTSFLFWW